MSVWQRRNLNPVSGLLWDAVVSDTVYVENQTMISVFYYLPLYKIADYNLASVRNIDDVADWRDRWVRVSLDPLTYRSDFSNYLLILDESEYLKINDKN